PIYNIGVDGERRPFYAMKLVKGRTLQAVLNAIRDGDPAAVKDYPLATLLTIFRKVCDAMSFAHSKRILHRDLKPENIMVGEYGEVLVMDWGLAKVLGGSGEEEHSVASTARVNELGDFGMTMEGEVMGTPQYMSPEQAEGMVAELDERSDIYSLGGVLYAILTLRPPIDGKTLNEVLSKVKSGQISSMLTKRGGKGAIEVGSPAAIGAEVPEALRAVTLKAMAKERTKRYASVEEFAADLEAYQNGFATRAEDAGALRLVLLFIKRNTAVSGVVALFLLVAIGFTLKLAASERIARANEKRALEGEQHAEANEKRALAATEVSRRETANALIALAEAAEESADAEQIRWALSKVPKDLRDATWKYLDRKSDAADLKIAPPDGIDWLEVDQCPDDPTVVVAAQKNGQISVVDTQTGQITGLWKAERKGFSLQSINVGDRSATTARLSPEFLFVKTVDQLKPGDVLRGWDLSTGKPAWECAGVRAFHLSGDFQTVFCVKEGGIFEKLSASNGAVIFSAEKRFPSPHPAFPETCLIERDASLKEAASIYFGKTQVYGFNAKTADIRWEVKREGTPGIGLQLDPTGATLASLSSRSMLGSVLELRSAKTGALEEVFPFLGRLNPLGSDCHRIASSGSAFAVGFPKRILVWYFGKAQPVQKVSGTFFLSGTDRVQVTEPQKAKRTEICLLDPKEKAPQKSNPASLVLDAGLGMYSNVSKGLSGSKILLSWYELTAALQIKGGHIEKLWGPQRMSGAFGAVFAMHPTEDRFWMGRKVYEFSSGKELVTLAGDIHEWVQISVLNACGGWVGRDRIVTPVMVSAKDAENGEDQRVLYLWNANTGELVAQCPAQRVSALATSLDGEWIAEGGTDKRVRIRSGKTLEVSHELRVHDKTVHALVWHPHLPILVTGEEGRICLWSTKTWALLEELRVPRNARPILDVSPDGRRLSVFSASGTDVYEPKCFQE
ncbi:MAG: hypothetical protein EBS01_06740, partial [Verrucomicrobia bacterium]|nr:hypothetical protein [Verrucomicrobiota bacterium]